MGYLGYFYVENKAFEFRSNVQGGVQMAEKSRGKCRTVIMAWPTIFWLVSAWDYLTNIETSRENWRTFRFGCLAYVMQRRTNSHGNFLELSEYGGKGRRSFVIIPEGIEGKGWEDCRVQLQRLKIHQEKNRQKIGADRELVGKKEQSSGVQQTKPQVKITYAAAVVGEKAMAGETQTAGDGVQKEKTSLGITHAEAMVGGKEMAGKTQVAGEGPSKLVSEGANISAICSGDHTQPDGAILRPQNQGEDIQGIKEILISLQREVSSCLYKLEMGVGNKGKGENGLTFGSHKEVGSGSVRSSPGDKPGIRYFRKTYARRQVPRRLLRWRPKHMGRIENQATGESSETSRNRPPEQIISGTESELADKKKAQPNAEDITPSNGAIGGGEAVTTDEQAGTKAELAGNCGASSENADKTIYQPSTGVVPAAVTPVGEEGANGLGSKEEQVSSSPVADVVKDVLMAPENSRGLSGEVVGGFRKSLEVTKLASGPGCTAAVMAGPSLSEPKEAKPNRCTGDESGPSLEGPLVVSGSEQYREGSSPEFAQGTIAESDSGQLREGFSSEGVPETVQTWTEEAHRPGLGGQVTGEALGMSPVKSKVPGRGLSPEIPPETEQTGKLKAIRSGHGGQATGEVLGSAPSLPKVTGQGYLPEKPKLGGLPGILGAFVNVVEGEKIGVVTPLDKVDMSVILSVTQDLLAGKEDSPYAMDLKLALEDSGIAGLSCDGQMRELAGVLDQIIAKKCGNNGEHLSGLNVEDIHQVRGSIFVNDV
jgi:hypothetical protein